MELSHISFLASRDFLLRLSPVGRPNPFHTWGTTPRQTLITGRARSQPSMDRAKAIRFLAHLTLTLCVTELPIRPKSRPGSDSSSLTRQASSILRRGRLSVGGKLMSRAWRSIPTSSRGGI